MKIRILGCYGAQFPQFNPTGFLLNEHILIDAGTVTAVLGMEEQKVIDYILITHAHLDHIRDIAFLADNVKFKRQNPVVVISTATVIDQIKTHLFNNVIWPDFSSIPTMENPIVHFRSIGLDSPFYIDNMKIRAIRVHHTVETVSYVIDDGSRSVIFIGDTGPTEAIWEVANGLNNLKAIFVETSLPDSMADVAEITGHLTPSRLADELSKLHRNSLNVYLYHVKPQYFDRVSEEVEHLNNDNVRLLHDGETIML